MKTFNNKTAVIIGGTSGMGLATAKHVQGKPRFTAGLGRALLTPILMCVYPDKYSV